MIIDVSHHNGVIDWKLVGTQIDYAIIRCGYGTNSPNHDDKQFNYNATQCEKFGIPYGVYIYSYATSLHQCESEINHILRCVKNRRVIYPLYYDIEENVTFESGLAKQFAYMFIDKVRKEGYKAGIYSGDYNFLRNFNDINCDSKWVARYNNVSPQSNYDIWQYSSKGRLIGLTGNVDCNALEDSSLFSKAHYESYVDAILDNDYGTGVNRKNALFNEGINYWYVQTLVNKRLRGK